MEISNPSLAENVRSLLADAFQVSLEEITSDLAFGDLPQWDSMGHMDLMLRLEEAYGIEINAESIAGLVSLPAILEKLENKDQTHE
ncbi:MAG TPA: acyl carrier protein [Anaerolineales bacterium]|nr:acyl carrier protein [Anaerolineales bacterium]